MRCAIIKNGIVINVINLESPEEWIHQERYVYDEEGKASKDVQGNIITVKPNIEDLVIESDMASPGDRYEGGTFIPAPPPVLTALQKIALLEMSITKRRLREAVIGVDNGWLENVDKQIDKLRKEL